MRDGILLVDKPAGISSAGVVARVKRMLKAGRVGHAGTLDPDATGLLVILVNGATRVASYAADGFKVYSGTIRLGVTTSTDDLAGEELQHAPVDCTWDQIVRATGSLTGKIDQIPPKVSAKKLGGKRAYKLHHQGVEFELASRAVEVRVFDVSQDECAPNEITYRVEVSPGTYVRALARDLGSALGCGAAVATIRRESSGRFSVREACDLNQVTWDHVRDWGDLVPEVPRLALGPKVASGLANGQLWALEEAWKEWRNLGVELPPTHVVYHARESQGSWGILKVIPEGGFQFGLNISQHLREQAER